ncbi:FAD/NAD(P)-binding domain-containing protein [Poronia punctata]|nr:FAD/NAD(P)-binding domain-containing protein [Poronia punctata]
MTAEFVSRFGEDPADRDAVRRLKSPIHDERQIRIAVIGAGASGLLLAYQIQKHFNNYMLTVYEKNPAVAGTWYENRYPGCACDVPSHNYTWSFEPKTDWSSVYPGRDEIFEYFEGFAKKYQLYRYIQLQHQVVGAYWNNSRAGYDLKIKDLVQDKIVEDRCDILINAGGVLNNWRWPDIPGLKGYKGTLLHAARWDESVELKGKRVGLIGNGSTGVQLLPFLQEICSNVTVFIRQPGWVSPVQGLQQHQFSEEERWKFATNPGALQTYRKTVENGLNGMFSVYLKGTKLSEETRQYILGQMREKLGDNKHLAEQLIPKFSFGCRRLTPGPGYLEALTKPNVRVSYGNIKAITERGCLVTEDDGNEHEHCVDMLVCATGFDTSFRPRFPIVSHTGVNLQDKWATKAESYLGVAAAGFPNYMCTLGPNSPIGNGPVLAAVEAQVEWICRMIDRYQTTNIKMFTPKEEAVRDFVEFKDQFMEKTVWTDDCHSWYKGPEGEVRALWPGSSLHYMECMKDLRLDDFSVTYAGNRFAWLGNGYSRTEVDDTADWSYYIRENDDDSPPLTTAEKRKMLSKSGTVKDRDMVKYT